MEPDERRLQRLRDAAAAKLRHDLEHAHAALGMDAEEACQPPFCGEMAPQRSGLRAAAQIRQGIVKQMIVARRLRGVFRRQRADGAGRDLGRRRLQVQQRLIGLLSVQAKFALHGVGGLVREDGEARVLRNGHAPQYAQQGARIRNAAEKAVSARLQQHALRSVVQRAAAAGPAEHFRKEKPKILIHDVFPFQIKSRGPEPSRAEYVPGNALRRAR